MARIKSKTGKQMKMLDKYKNASASLHYHYWNAKMSDTDIGTEKKKEIMLRNQSRAKQLFRIKEKTK